MNDKIYMARRISLHPKFAAVVDALFSLVLMFVLRYAGEWWIVGVWFLLRVGVWSGLIRLVYYPKEISRLRHLFSLLVFALGTTLLLLFIEWSVAWQILFAATIFLSAGSFWLLPPVESKLPFMPKPHRRWLLFLNMFGIAGIWSGAYAISAFQILYMVSTWVWMVLASVIATVIAGWWWREYGIKFGRRMMLWSAVWFLIMLEMGWAIMFLPLGFFASGLFLTWLWYDLWLLVRFNLSVEGINWKKQRFFVIMNLILMVSFLAFVVRWK